MAERLYMTNSEQGTVRTCEKRWKFAYPDRLRPVRTPRPLTVGSAVHEGIAEVYRYLQDCTLMIPPDVDTAKERAMAAMLLRLDHDMTAFREASTLFEWSEQEVAEESTVAIAEAEAALALFIDRFLVEDWQTYEVVAVEKAFDVPVRNPNGNYASNFRIRGRFDVVLRARGAWPYIVLGEHKTIANDAMLADFRLDVDPQVRAYTYALRHEYGDRARGTVLLNVVRKVRPKEPSINKDGTVSTAAVDTLRSIYADACRTQQEPGWLVKARADFNDAHSSWAAKPVDERQTVVDKAAAKVTRKREARDKQEQRWNDLLVKQNLRAEQLPTVVDRWAARHVHHVTDAALLEWERDAYYTSRHLRDLRSGRRLPVANGASCTSVRSGVCPYRSICVEDREEIRQSHFVQRVHEHAEAIDDLPEGSE